VEGVESKVMRFEETADEFVRRRLSNFLEESALSSDEADIFRLRAQRVLERQSKAFEEVIEATDRALSERVGVVATERERLKAELGAEYEAEYERANLKGHAMSLNTSRPNRFSLFGIVRGSIGLVLNTAKNVVGSPLFVVNTARLAVFRVDTKERQKTSIERTVEELEEFRQMTPTKSPRLSKLAPASPDARSDAGSILSSRRWPLGATAQRLRGATKRYSVAGSVRSGLTRYTAHSELESISEDDEEFGGDPRKARRHLMRVLIRALQLGCVTAVVTLSVGPEHRAERTRQLMRNGWNNINIHVGKGWSAVVLRWATISAKLTPTPMPNKDRPLTKRPTVVIQIPEYIPLGEDDVDDVQAPDDLTETPDVIGVDTLRAFGRG
jgi:hypothetical protein